MFSRTLSLSLALAAIGLSASIAHAQTIYSEDFESYARGSNLVGQGGWVQNFGAAPLVVNNTGPLPTNVADGLLKQGDTQNIYVRPVADLLPPGKQSILSADAYASKGVTTHGLVLAEPVLGMLCSIR